MYLKNAVLFRPQFSLTSASEIHVFGDNIFSAIEICLYFCIEERLSLVSNKEKKLIDPGRRFRDKRRLVFLASQSP